MITAPVVVVAALAVFAVFEAYAFGLLKKRAACRRSGRHAEALIERGAALRTNSLV